MTPDPNRIAQAIRATPIWARLALTSSRDHLVDRAAETMAAIIAHELARDDQPDRRQMPLPTIG